MPDIVTVLSPHRDDAVFSLGLTLAAWSTAGLSISVVNFFTRSAYGPRLNTSDPDVVSRIRKREDRIALKRVAPAVRVIDIELLDAPLRLHIQLGEICSPDTQRLLKVEEVSSLARLIQTMTRRGLVLAPLALGNHIDHLTIHRASIAASRVCRIAYYEDLPYAAWTTEQALRSRICELSSEELRPFKVRVRNPVHGKRKFIAPYGSQITNTEAALIANFSTRYGGERIWYPAHSNRWRSTLRHATIASR